MEIGSSDLTTLCRSADDTSGPDVVFIYLVSCGEASP